MGEDIHQRIFVKSKKTGQYINAHDICSWDPKYSMFKEFIDGRSYDLFALFGSNRSDYNELNYANYGMPNFLKGSVFDDYCRESGYYGFIWFKFSDFIKALTEYADQLKSPFKYLEEDSDSYSYWNDLLKQIQKDENPDKFLEQYREWLDGHKNVLDSLHEMIDQLNSYLYNGKCTCAIYDKIIDIKETIFLFFFDN